MTEHLENARRLIAADPNLAGFQVSLDGDELHLAKGDDSFARLIPVDTSGHWRIEAFHNEKRWERIDFTGPLKECLELISASPHYFYWGR